MFNDMPHTGMRRHHPVRKVFKKRKAGSVEPDDEGARAPKIARVSEALDNTGRNEPGFPDWWANQHNVGMAPRNATETSSIIENDGSSIILDGMQEVPSFVSGAHASEANSEEGRGGVLEEGSWA